MEATHKEFTCGCGGQTRVIDAETVEHACKHKYAPGTSFYDGVARFVRYERVALVAGGFKWFVKWE